MDVSESLHILVAEDIDSNYLLVKAILRNMHVERAVDGVKAVEMAKNSHYDCILMDMKMPNMDGLEATRHIREFDKQVSIIAVTANAFDSDRKNALEAGCNDFVTKPITRGSLLDAIEKQGCKIR